MGAASEITCPVSPSRAAARGHGRTVLLLAANGRLGYQVLRCVQAVESVARVVVLGSIGESSWPTRGLRASRFCAEFIEAEQHFTSPGLVGQVDRVAERLGDAIIVPADLAATRFLAEHSRRLAAPCAPTPSLAALDLLARKDAFAAFCKAARLPHPPTIVAADDAEARRVLAQRAPGALAVLKPLGGQGGAGVRIVDAGDPHWRVRYRPILVQDYVPGRDLSASAFCEGGRVVAFQAYRHVTRLVGSKPVHTGIDFFGAPQFAALVERVAALAELNGIVNFDARLGADGRLALLECNPRPWFTMAMAMLAGNNFATLWFDADLRRRGMPSVERSLIMFPGALLGGQTAGAHLRHMLADAWYYLSADAPSRAAVRLRRRNPSLD